MIYDDIIIHVRKNKLWQPIHIHIYTQGTVSVVTKCVRKI